HLGRMSDQHLTLHVRGVRGPIGLLRDGTPVRVIEKLPDIGEARYLDQAVGFDPCSGRSLSGAGGGEPHARPPITRTESSSSGTTRSNRPQCAPSGSAPTSMRPHSWATTCEVARCWVPACASRKSLCRVPLRMTYAPANRCSSWLISSTVRVDRDAASRDMVSCSSLSFLPLRIVRSLLSQVVRSSAMVPRTCE